jgi:hypothetical protein
MYPLNGEINGKNRNSTLFFFFFSYVNVCIFLCAQLFQLLVAVRSNRVGAGSVIVQKFQILHTKLFWIRNTAKLNVAFYKILRTEN